MALILIAGFGDIGLRLTAKLSGRHQLVAARRNWHHAPDGVVPIACDLTDALAVKSLPKDVDGLIFMATPGAGTETAYQAIYQTALTRLMNHYVNRAPVSIMVSSTSVYGQNQGEWVDETSPTEPIRETSQWIVKGEKMWLEQRQPLIVRFSGIYGPGREYLLNKARQAPSIPCTPPSYSNRVHQQDAAASLAFLLEKALEQQPLDTIYLVSDDQPAPIWDVVTWLAAAMQCPPPKAEQRLPSAAQNKRCRNQKIKDLGFNFQYPDYRAGYGAMLKSSGK